MCLVNSRESVSAVIIIVVVDGSVVVDRATTALRKATIILFQLSPDIKRIIRWLPRSVETEIWGIVCSYFGCLQDLMHQHAFLL